MIACIYFCSLEIILRAETVEMVQAGDKCDFIGTLIAVPDVSQLRTEGREGEGWGKSKLLFILPSCCVSLKGSEVRPPHEARVVTHTTLKGSVA